MYYLFLLVELLATAWTIYHIELVKRTDAAGRRL